MALQQTISLAQAGISPAALARFLDTLEKEQIDLHSMLIARGGKVACEAYRAPYSAQSATLMHSFTKSVTATAIGILCDEGRLTEETKVLSIFPEYAEGAGENLRAMRVCDLLSMTCGHEREPDGWRDVDDFVQVFFETPVPYRPGTHFAYNTLGSNMLAAILLRVTGQTLTEFLRLRLFEPLGIGTVRCETCYNGIQMGGSGLFLRTRDMAALAQLYLNGGEWEGRQIVSRAWIEKASGVRFAASHDGNTWNRPDWEQGYGYQLWQCVPEGVYRFDGAFGQFAIIDPAHQLSIVMTCATEKTQELLTYLWEMVYSELDRIPIKGDAAPDGPVPVLRPCCVEGAGVQEHIFRAASFEKNACSFIPTNRLQIRKINARLAARFSGISSLEVDMAPEGGVFRFVENGLRNSIPFGWHGDWREGAYFATAFDYKTAAAAAIGADGSLRLQIRLRETAFTCDLRISFGEKLRVYIDQLPRGGAPLILEEK